MRGDETMGAQAVRRLGVVQGWGNGAGGGYSWGQVVTVDGRRRGAPLDRHDGGPPVARLDDSRPLLSVMLMLQVEGLRCAHSMHLVILVMMPGGMSLDEAELRGRDTKEVCGVAGWFV